MALEATEKECTTKMAKAVEFLKQELRGVRTGRATPGLIEHVKIEVQSYGSTMELRELATIAVPEPSTLLVKPFDPTTLKDIEKSLQTSSLGVTPVNDGKAIRLPIPPLSGERRQQLVAQVRKMAEAQKIAIRNARRDGNKAADAAQKAKTASEDEAKDAKERIQKQTKKHEDEVDGIVAAKAKEIEEV
ncbi:MAG: ribosome recycling factor [Phycisphaerales bacterium]|nr:MAG: ribosome recycling factor [Phycisphaerales bacterium]